MTKSAKLIYNGKEIDLPIFSEKIPNILGEFQYLASEILRFQVTNGENP